MCSSCMQAVLHMQLPPFAYQRPTPSLQHAYCLTVLMQAWRKCGVSAAWPHLYHLHPLQCGSINSKHSVLLQQCTGTGMLAFCVHNVPTVQFVALNAAGKEVGYMLTALVFHKLCVTSAVCCCRRRGWLRWCALHEMQQQPLTGGGGSKAGSTRRWEDPPVKYSNSHVKMVCLWHLWLCAGFVLGDSAVRACQHVRLKGRQAAAAVAVPQQFGSQGRPHACVAMVVKHQRS